MLMQRRVRLPSLSHCQPVGAIAHEFARRPCPSPSPGRAAPSRSRTAGGRARSARASRRSSAAASPSPSGTAARGCAARRGRPRSARPRSSLTNTVLRTADRAVGADRLDDAIGLGRARPQRARRRRLDRRAARRAGPRRAAGAAAASRPARAAAPCSGAALQLALRRARLTHSSTCCLRVGLTAGGLTSCCGLAGSAGCVAELLRRRASLPSAGRPVAIMNARPAGSPARAPPSRS